LKFKFEAEFKYGAIFKSSKTLTVTYENFGLDLIVELSKNGESLKAEISNTTNV
jgi:hypothetical protein